jgi:hypothetical protein
MPSEHRRRQILDDDTEEARFDTRAAGDTSAPGNGRGTSRGEDSWVRSFMGRLAALVRDVGGREK